MVVKGTARSCSHTAYAVMNASETEKFSAAQGIDSCVGTNDCRKGHEMRQDSDDREVLRLDFRRVSPKTGCEKREVETATLASTSLTDRSWPLEICRLLCVSPLDADYSQPQKANLCKSPQLVCFEDPREGSKAQPVGAGTDR